MEAPRASGRRRPVSSHRTGVGEPYDGRVSGEPTQAELEAAFCWESADLLPGRPSTTAFRRRIRLHQARWRTAHGHPIGTEPIRPRPGVDARPVGSRLPLDYAQATGAQFVTPGALDAARVRLATPEPRQSFDHQRTWADLLWAPAMAFNLFGDLAADHALATRALRAWVPDAPGTVVDVRFAHSPGRLDPQWLNSLRAFDAAFILDRGDGTRGIVGIDVEYHDWLKPETPKPENLWRTLAVAEDSGAFGPGATDILRKTSPLCLVWLEHLLLLSMLQHPSREWTWGRYLVVHPASNDDVAAGLERYRGLLEDTSTFATITLEALLDADALPKAANAALRERYLPS